MEYRRLGTTGLSASAIGFGCNRIARVGSENDRREVIATLESAFEHGINFFDTANAYGDGESERLLGRVFRGRRDRLLLCSKAGHRSWVRLEVDRWVFFPNVHRRRPRAQRGEVDGQRRERRRRRNFAPRYLRLGIEGSLRRLGTDYLDVFYLHGPPPEVIADDGVFETLERLKQRGWIRHYGISFPNRATADQVSAALRHPGVAVVQVLVNPLESVDLERLVPETARAGVAVVGRQPFHRGAVFAAPACSELLGVQRQRTPAQTVLRSVLQRHGVDVVLVGMRSRRHLDENLAAVQAPPLTAEEMQRLYAETRIR